MLISTHIVSKLINACWKHELTRLPKTCPGDLKFVVSGHYGHLNHINFKFHTLHTYTSTMYMYMYMYIHICTCIRIVFIPISCSFSLARREYFTF